MPATAAYPRGTPLLICLDPSEEFHDAVERDAGDAGVIGTPLRAVSTQELDRHLAAGRTPDAVLIGPGLEPSDGVEVARSLREQLPGVIVLQVAVPTTATLRAALRAGIRDVLSPSFTAAELGEALRQAGYGASIASDELDGLTIAVFSAKGGVGTSVLASNLALRLQLLAGAPTVLVDLDLASADQAVLHGLRPNWTVQDLADGTVGDDIDAVEQVLLQIPNSDVRVLAGPMDPAAAEAITDTAVMGILHRLRQLVPMVVIDTASAFTDVTLSVLEHADVIVLPVSLDVLSLRSLNVTLQTFDRLHISRERVRVVVMRSDAKVGLTLDDVVRTTGVDVDVAVPSSREVPRSLNTATPLALDSPRSSVVKAVDELVTLLTDGVAIEGADEGAVDTRRGMFGRRRPVSLPEPVVAASDVQGEVPPRTGLDDTAMSDETDDSETAPARVAPRVVRRRAVVVTGDDNTHSTTDSEPPDADDGPMAPVIDLNESSERLTSMPPPAMDTRPANKADEPQGRRRNSRN